MSIHLEMKKLKGKNENYKNDMINKRYTYANLVNPETAKKEDIEFIQKRLDGEWVVKVKTRERPDQIEFHHQIHKTKYQEMVHFGFPTTIGGFRQYALAKKDLRSR